MADAKRCDVCGAFFDTHLTGVTVERYFGQRQDDTRGHGDDWGRTLWDVCSAECLLALALRQGGDTGRGAEQVR